MMLPVQGAHIRNHFCRNTQSKKSTINSSETVPSFTASSSEHFWVKVHHSRNESHTTFNCSLLRCFLARGTTRAPSHIPQEFLSILLFPRKCFCVGAAASHLVQIFMLDWSDVLILLHIHLSVNIISDESQVLINLNLLSKYSFSRALKSVYHRHCICMQNQIHYQICNYFSKDINSCVPLDYILYGQFGVNQLKNQALYYIITKFKS